MVGFIFAPIMIVITGILFIVYQILVSRTAKKNKGDNTKKQYSSSSMLNKQKKPK